MAKQRRAAREAAQADADARAMGRAVARASKDAGSGGGRTPARITCRPARQSGQRKSGVKLTGFERALGLNVPNNRKSGGGGRASSFHFRLTPRGLGQRRAGGRGSYSRGEAVRAVRYILRALAREIPEAGVVSSISNDADEIATVFAALEELEIVAGRANANVYTSLVVSLPHELNAGEREVLLAGICEPLADAGLPYAAVLHKPDPRGDQRNFHAHVLFSWRPVEKLEDGTYAFQATTHAALNTPAFVTAFRAHAADRMNEAMAQADQPRRFTALSRAALGETPADPAAAKKTPGQNHAERRAAKVAMAKAECEQLDRRKTALGELVRALEAVRDEPSDDLCGRLAGLQRQEAVLIQAARAKAAANSGASEEAPPRPRPDGAPALPQPGVVGDQREVTAVANVHAQAARTSPPAGVEPSPVVNSVPIAEVGERVVTPARAKVEPSSAPEQPPPPSTSDPATRSGDAASRPSPGIGAIAEAREAARARTPKSVMPIGGSPVLPSVASPRDGDQDTGRGRVRRSDPAASVPEAGEAAAPLVSALPTTVPPPPWAPNQEDGKRKQRAKGPASITEDGHDASMDVLWAAFQRDGQGKG